ncbi:MAG: DUF2851 family protein [Puniceicoccales bacterium]|jgi:hypothetical protein|nr:DUF2851 family protein [Puniceicoccales bacterium]
MKSQTLAEISGLYGPVCVHERVLQKIWLRGDFRQGEAHLLSGKKIRRVKSGRWNHEGGPDFIDAILEIDGQIVCGDVEVHFYAEDWHSHGHTGDPAFSNVILHLVLFPPRSSVIRKTHTGRPLETLVLLSLLNEDIEDYANREALLALESREQSGWNDALLARDEAERLPLLREKAARRWQQKVSFASLRVKKHGWDEACHQFALETLGLHRNRAPMSALSLRFPLENMRTATAPALFAEQRDAWHLSGLRPASHPLRRIQQYLVLLAAYPDWPTRFFQWGCSLAIAAIAPDIDTARFRKTHRFSSTAKKLQHDILADAIGGTRLNTLAVDALMPLLAANGIDQETCERYWFHWRIGDVPERLANALRSQLPPEEGKIPVVCNGLFQGLLQLSREHG